jgi:hypothetical protein
MAQRSGKHPCWPSVPNTLCGISIISNDYGLIEARLSEHFGRDPLKPFIDNPDALDYRLAGDCMQLYIYRLMERTLGREGVVNRLPNRTLDLGKFRARLKTDDAGAKALSWLLSSSNHEQMERTDQRYRRVRLAHVEIALIRDGRAVRLSPNAIITLHRCLRIQFAEPLIQYWSFSVGQSPMKKQ